jgi:integrase
MRASELRGLSWRNVELGKDTGIIRKRPVRAALCGGWQ